MRHPIFDCSAYPWARPEAVHLFEMLVVSIPQPAEIAQYYARAGGEAGSLNTAQAARALWGQALELLAQGHALRRLCEEVLPGVHRLANATEFQAALRAVVVSAAVPETSGDIWNEPLRKAGEIKLEKAHEAILQAFSRHDLQRLVQFRFSRSLEEIGDGDLTQIVFELLMIAQREGWIKQLLEAMLETRNNNDKFRAAVAPIISGMQTDPPVPSSRAQRPVPPLSGTLTRAELESVRVQGPSPNGNAGDGEGSAFPPEAAGPDSRSTIEEELNASEQMRNEVKRPHNDDELKRLMKAIKKPTRASKNYDDLDRFALVFHKEIVKLTARDPDIRGTWVPDKAELIRF